MNLSRCLLLTRNLSVRSRRPPFDAELEHVEHYMRGLDDETIIMSYGCFLKGWKCLNIKLVTELKALNRRSYEMYFTRLSKKKQRELLQKPNP